MTRNEKIRFILIKRNQSRTSRLAKQLAKMTDGQLTELVKVNRGQTQ